MSTRPRSFQPVLLAATIALGAFGAYRAGANSRQLALTPSVVATVDMEKLMAGLAEKTARDEVIALDQKKKQTVLDEMKVRLDKLNGELDILNKESIEYRNKRAEAYELREHATSTQKIYQQLIALDSGEVVRVMYEKACAAIAKVAAKDGYTLVLLDDRGLTMPKVAPIQEMSSYVLNKRVIYSAEGADITDRIIAEMNNEYGAPAKK